MAEQVVDETMERIHRVAPWSAKQSGLFICASRAPGSDRILFHFDVHKSGKSFTTNFSFHDEDAADMDDETLARELWEDRRIAVNDLMRIANEG